jgi:hypothetical protein
MEVKVLLALASCGDFETGRNCHPSVETIAARAGVSRASVTRTLAALRDAGWIVVRAWRRRHATRYDICVDRFATRQPSAQQAALMVDPEKLEAQFEPSTYERGKLEETLEAQFEPSTYEKRKLEAQFEPPTSTKKEERTHTPRAREAREDPTPELALLGETPPPRCAHPHAHAWCDGRVHVPRALHFEFLDRLGTRPGETPAAKAGRLIAFYAADQTRLPASQSVADSFNYWKAAFTAWIAREDAAPAPEPVASAPYDAVWRQVRERIATKVNRHTFYTWFTPLVMVTCSPTLIEVTKQGPQSGLFAAWVQKHYADVVRSAVEEVRPGARVEVIDVWAIERQQKSG